MFDPKAFHSQPSSSNYFLTANILNDAATFLSKVRSAFKIPGGLTCIRVEVKLLRALRRLLKHTAAVLGSLCTALLLGRCATSSAAVRVSGRPVHVQITFRIHDQYIWINSISLAHDLRTLPFQYLRIQLAADSLHTATLDSRQQYIQHTTPCPT